MRLCGYDVDVVSRNSYARHNVSEWWTFVNHQLHRSIRTTLCWSSSFQQNRFASIAWDRNDEWTNSNCVQRSVERSDQIRFGSVFTTILTTKTMKSFQNSILGFRENRADLAISWDTRPSGCVLIRWICGIGISQTLSLLPVNWNANAAMPLPSSSLPDPTNTWNRNEMQKPSCGTSTTLLRNSEWNSFSSFLETKRKCERHSQRIRIGPV